MSMSETTTTTAEEANMITTLPRMRGSKWFNSATYLTEETRKSTLSAIEAAKRSGCTSVGVRPASYIGPDSGSVAVTYGPGGGSLYTIV